MSHVVTIQTEVRDEAAVRAACGRLQLPTPQVGLHRLFSESVEGLAVKLPGWRYPAVCELQTGAVRYDTFGGRWGEESHLGRFLQAYAVEKARLEARRRGHSVSERLLTDGSIRLTVGVG